MSTSSLSNSNTPALSWMNRQGYLQGVFFITLVALTSNMNDILMRYAGRLPSIEVTFFRYFFATLSLLIIYAANKNVSLKTDRIGLHVIRAGLLCIAMICWSKAVTMVPLAVMSTLALTVPLFVLPMAKIFLKEHVGIKRTLATLTGFIGILIIVLGRSNPDAVDSQVITASLSSDYGFFSSLSMLLDNGKAALTDLNNGAVILIIASICFAASDVINKKFVTRESTIVMLFYIALFTMAFAASMMYFTSTTWVMPTTPEFAFLSVLGIGGNLILYFLLKAFAATEVSALAPYRYSELIFAAAFGYILFGELLNTWTYIGSGIIVLATAIISYVEIKGRT